MTHHFGKVGIYWQRTALLVLVFISTIFIIYQTETSDDSSSGIGEFYEDFGNEVPEKEKLINAEEKSKEKRLEGVQEPRDSAVKQSADSAQQELDASLSPVGMEIPASARNAETPTNDMHYSIQASANQETSTATLPPQQVNPMETPKPFSESLEDQAVSLAPVQEQLATTTIPKIIHQSARSEILPIAYQSLIESCLSLNADWRYYMWRDRDRNTFLQLRYPQHADRFRKLADRQLQDQVFRFFVLQTYGGIYLDLDMECLKPIEPLLTNTSLFVGAERPELAKIVRNVDQSADISAVAGTPHHEVFIRILDQLTSLPYESIDVSAILTASFDSAGNCTLQDYHYFGSALDDSFPWNNTCMEVFQGDNLPSNASETSSPEQQLDNKQQGCIALRERNYNLLDLSSDSLAVRRYINVSPTDSSGSSFNLTQKFIDRVTYYSRQK